jgi:hypothetical protein
MFLSARLRLSAGVVWVLGVAAVGALAWAFTVFGPGDVAHESAWREPQDIFITTTEQVSADEVVFEYAVPPAHALERANFRFQAQPDVISEVIYPPATLNTKTGHEQYLERVRIRVLLAKGQGRTGHVTAIAQGCNLDLDVCYIPFAHRHTLQWP